MSKNTHKAKWIRAQERTNGCSFDVWQFGEFTFEISRYEVGGNFKGVIRHPAWKTATVFAPGALSWDGFIEFCEEVATTLERLLRAQYVVAQERGDQPHV
jgi:hypothetical protein